MTESEVYAVTDALADAILADPQPQPPVYPPIGTPMPILSGSDIQRIIANIEAAIRALLPGKVIILQIGDLDPTTPLG